MDYKLALTFFLVAWYITNNEYSKQTLEYIYDKFRHPIPSFLIEVVSCFKCLSFFLILFSTFDVTLALGGAFIANIYGNYYE